MFFAAKNEKSILINSKDEMQLYEEIFFLHFYFYFK